MRDLPKLVAITASETEVDVELWRIDERKVVKVAIGGSEPEKVALDLPGTSSDTGKLGLSLGSLNSENREKYGIEESISGVVIVDVEPDSAAADRGLREGDVIRRVGKNQVESPKDVKEAVDASREAEKKSVLLLVERDSQVRYVVVPMTS